MEASKLGGTRIFLVICLILTIIAAIAGGVLLAFNAIAFNNCQTQESLACPSLVCKSGLPPTRTETSECDIDQ